MTKLLTAILTIALAIVSATRAEAQWNTVGRLDAVTVGARIECDYRVRVEHPLNDILFALIPLDRAKVNDSRTYLRAIVDDDTLSLLSHYMPSFPRGSATPKRSLARRLGHTDEVLLRLTLEEGHLAEASVSACSFARRGQCHTEPLATAYIFLEERCG